MEKIRASQWHESDHGVQLDHLAVRRGGERHLPPPARGGPWYLRHAVVVGEPVRDQAPQQVIPPRGVEQKEAVELPPFLIFLAYFVGIFDNISMCIT